MKLPDPFQHPVLFFVAIGLASIFFFMLLSWFISIPRPPREIIIHFDSPLIILKQEPK